MAEGLPTTANPSLVCLPSVVTPAVVLTYTAGGTIQAPDMKAGSFFTVTITDGAAFTLPNPLNLPAGLGCVFYVFIKNASGGALGAMSLGTIYKASAALLTDIAGAATGQCRLAPFIWDGTSVRELAISSRSVPN